MDAGWLGRFGEDQGFYVPLHRPAYSGPGDLLTRLSSNSVLRELLTAQTTSVVLDGLLVSSYLVLLFWLAPLIALCALAFGALQAAVIVAANARASRLAQADLRAQSASQSELVDHIYAQDFDRDSNTIEVFIARLRRKLGAALIETVRGLGYRIGHE